MAASKNPRKVLVLHGPNLNLLGLREPEHYGQDTLDAINSRLLEQAKTFGIELETFQSNSEAELISKVQSQANGDVGFIIINPALAAVKISFVEVHLSNIYARESFRHHSYFSDIAIGVISGLGAESYSLALTYVIHQLRD